MLQPKADLGPRCSIGGSGLLAAVRSNAAYSFEGKCFPSRDGPKRPSDYGSCRCGAARQRRHSPQARNQMCGELVVCRTKRTCAHAAIADAATIRSCSTIAAAMYPKSPELSLQLGVNGSWWHHLCTCKRVLRPQFLTDRSYSKPVSAVQLSFRNATKASKTIRTR